MASRIPRTTRRAVLTAALRTEDKRDAAARRVACAICGAAPGQRCTYPAAGTLRTNRAHTGRYNAAVRARLVPALGGGTKQKEKIR